MEGVTLEARRLTKRYGARAAVEDLSFTAREGRCLQRLPARVERLQLPTGWTTVLVSTRPPHPRAGKDPARPCWRACACPHPSRFGKQVGINQSNEMAEPVIIAVLGASVGGIVISLYMPLFAMIAKLAG